jgi:hypothetical protein
MGKSAWLPEEKRASQMDFYLSRPIIGIIKIFSN